MARTTTSRVESVLGNHWDGSTDVDTFITTANILTTRIAQCDEDGDLTSAELAEIEAQLAAHFYSIQDQIAKSEKAAEASASYVGQTGMRLQFTPFGQQALVLDHTGCLKRLDSERGRVQFAWLGKPKSNQTDYVDRD